MTRRLPLGLVLVAAVVLAAGAAGAIWAAGQSGTTVGDTARFVPADVAVYATINTDPTSRQWIQMHDLLARLGVDRDAELTRDRGLLFVDLKWDKDVAPYIGGEATIALRGLDGIRPEMIAVLATQDGGKAWDHAVKVLDERAEQAGVTPGARSHRGTTIRSYHDESLGGSFWIARKDRYLLLGTVDADADRALDLAAGKGESLAGLERFRTARAAVTDDSLFFLYVNPAAAGEAAAGLASAFVPTAPAGTLDAAGLERTAVAVAASAERTGLRFEWQVVGLDPSLVPVKLAKAPDESRLARRAPADTLVFVAGADLFGSYITGAIDALDRAARENSAGAPSFDARETIDGFSREVGFDVERDLLRQMDGEYAVALGARELDGDSIWVLGMSLVKDGATVSRSLAKLADYARSQGETVRTSTAGGATLTQIEASGTPGDGVVFTVAGDELVAGSDVAVVRQALAGGALDRDPEYREALRALPSGRSLTGYVNLGRVMTVAGEPGPAGLRNLRTLAFALTHEGDRAGGVAFLRVGGE